MDVYPWLPPPKIKPTILKKLLLACTTSVTFYNHLGNNYTQTSGVGMGSSIASTLS